MSDKAFAGFRKEGTRAHGYAGLPLSEIRPEDELLHAPAVSGHHSATETSYYGFSIPEHAINGEIYVWFHPVLQVISASVYIWKGIKASTLECEYINHYNYLPFPKNDIGDYAIDDLNLAIKVVEPLKRVDITFDDRDRGVSFVLRQDAIMPPAGRPGGFHFTQAVKTTGSLNLYGEQFTIDGYFSRDRSWGQERRETAQKMPPLSWMVGVFGDDLAFHVMAFDDPARNPEWIEAFPDIPAGGNLLWGYVFDRGELTPLRHAGKLTHREADGLAPRRIELELIDVKDRQWSITGDVQARMPWQTWQNMNTFFCQTRWEHAGRIGWGDVQDVQFNEFTHRFSRRNAVSG
jgi:hypothetical protein